MSGTPTRLTMRAGRLRSSMVSAKEPLVTARTSSKPARARAARIAASAAESGSISKTRGIVSGSLARRRHREQLDQLNERGLLDRFGDVMLDAELPCEVDVLGARARGQHHHRQSSRRRPAVEVTDQLVAVQSRHLEIGDDDVHRVLRELLERLGA